MLIISLLVKLKGRYLSLCVFRTRNARHVYNATQRPASYPPHRYRDFQADTRFEILLIDVGFSHTAGMPISVQVRATSLEIYGRVPRTKSNAQMLGELDVATRRIRRHGPVALAVG